ncbi:hypothetical protein Hamer_G023098 [Homarus americanus]|uniref:Uncharacterized protein n=1 Tax=Homarus americanus TaxID=6706 RepID=A0A8J5N1Z7_HOMAM|nr:hypothetical protein Hamer_G023098 [Homarus americanus]
MKLWVVLVSVALLGGTCRASYGCLLCTGDGGDSGAAAGGSTGHHPIDHYYGYGRGPYYNGGSHYGKGPYYNGGSHYDNGPYHNGGSHYGSGPYYNGPYIVRALGGLIRVDTDDDGGHYGHTHGGYHGHTHGGYHGHTHGGYHGHNHGGYHGHTQGGYHGHNHGGYHGHSHGGYYPYH